MNPKIIKWLNKRADNPRQNLAILGIGFATFFLGFVILGTAEYGLQSSVTQEIVALLGLIIISIGIILAAVGYLSLSVLRILRIINQNRKND